MFKLVYEDGVDLLRNVENKIEQWLYKRYKNTIEWQRDLSSLLNVSCYAGSEVSEQKIC
jgi:hypothetical protein